MLKCIICGKKFDDSGFPNVPKPLVPNVCPHHAKVLGRQMRGYEESQEPNNVDLIVERRVPRRGFRLEE